MELGFIGLGRMGLNMTIRLLQGGHHVVAYNITRPAVDAAASHGAQAAYTLEEMLSAVKPPRTLWAMIPAGKPVDELIESLLSRLAPGDLLVDGGNSNYKDSRRRHQRMKEAGFEFVDAGTSGGIWGLKVGYCLMVGGEDAAVTRLAPALTTLAPPDGWRHVGPAGAGHFAKMIHNGIEYGMMQSYAEGFEILRNSDYSYDMAELCRLWNQGSVVRSWLLELAGLAFEKDPGMDSIRGYVEDSGEGRWTVQEAIDRSVPAPLLTLALLTRFRSRQSDSYRDRVIAALRAQFGGHAVKEK